MGGGGGGTMAGGIKTGGGIGGTETPNQAIQT